ncbi:cupin domain-containing protein [Francisellaceae bacterium]|nr:cupin domain-containing protein [Francisellaceae bacterium]
MKSILKNLLVIGLLSTTYSVFAHNGADNSAFKPEVTVKQNVMEYVNDSKNWKQDVLTGAHGQVVMMSITPETNPKNEVGFEVHEGFDQIIYVTEGEAIVITGDKNEETVNTISKGDMIVIPSDTRHNVINLNDHSALKILSFYSENDTKVNKSYPTLASMY